MAGVVCAAAIAVAFAVGIFSASAAVAEDDSAKYRGPPPSWITEQPLPEVKQSRVSRAAGGFYYLLADRQVRWRPDAQISYLRIAYKIVDRIGLEEGARITVEFNPTREEVRFHSIQLHRDGKVLDRFADAKMQTYRREKELNQGIVDGYLTVHTDIPDLRVGDVVEYSYSTRKLPDFVLNEFSDEVGMAWTIPVGFFRYRVNLPNGKHLNIRRYGVELEPVKSSGADATEYEWVLEDPDPIASEDNVPVWHFSDGIRLSTSDSWSEIAASVYPHYRVEQELPSEFAAQVDRIAEAFPKTEDRITELLRLVQDSIRYVGIEIGPGAYIPRHPRETIRLGYGDCKDKTMVLAAALTRLNIDAVPALVHLEKGSGLKGRPPSLKAFNHVIVRIRHGDKTVWVDPTLSHQGGRAPEISPPNYGYALPVTLNSSALQKIEPEKLEVPGSKVTETFAFPPSQSGELELHVRSVYRGADADAIRFQFAGKSSAELERSYVKFYEQLYPGIRQTNPLDITDDRDRNRIVIEEFYRLGWKELTRNNLGKQFPLKAFQVSSLLANPTPAGRVSPVALRYPMHKVHRVNILGLQTRFRGPAVAKIDNQNLLFDISTESYRNSLHITWQLKTNTSQVTVEELPQYLTDVSQISEFSYLSYNFMQADSNFEFGLNFEAMILLVVLGVLLILIIFGVRYGLRADQAYAAEGMFFPVSVGKFSVMSVVTLGLYSCFWMLKHWLWQRHNSGAKIWPYWRAVFSPFWLYPAYSAARRRFEQDVPSQWPGIAGLIYCIAAAVGGAFIKDELLSFAVSWSSVLGFLPAVAVVNKLNQSSTDTLAKNSKFNRWNIIGIIVGLPILILMILGLSYDGQ